MYHANASTSSDLVALSPQTLYRGLYVRIAKKLGVDPSYVSRVARGERVSPDVEQALAHEIGQISKKLTSSRAENSRNRLERSQRLGSLVKQQRKSLQQHWLRHSQMDPNIKRIKLSSRKRVSPVMPLVDEAVKSMDLSLKEISEKPMKAARQHAAARRKQGYTPTTLLEEYNLIRRCIYSIAQENFKKLDPQLLVADLGILGEVLDFQSQSAMRTFLGQA